MLTTVMKYVGEIVGVIITLTIITVGISVYNTMTPVFEATNERSVQQARQAEEAEYSAYNSHIVSGSNVITAMRRYSNKPFFYVYVRGTRDFAATPVGDTTSAPAINFSSGKLESSGTVDAGVTVEQMLDESSEYYIPNQARYQATLVKDENFRVTGIYFSLK